MAHLFRIPIFFLMDFHFWGAGVGGDIPPPPTGTQNKPSLLWARPLGRLPRRLFSRSMNMFESFVARVGVAYKDNFRVLFASFKELLTCGLGYLHHRGAGSEQLLASLLCEQ